MTGTALAQSAETGEHQVGPSEERSASTEVRTSSNPQRVGGAVVDVTLETVDPYQPWQESSRCKDFDPEIFFPEKGGSSREAKRICADCEVRLECLNYALRRDERYGVWGGMSERERRRLKRMAS